MTTYGADPAWEPERLRLGRLVLVPVGEFDQRAARAVAYASTVPGREHRALHVVTDEALADTLAREWMSHGVGFPLYFAESDGGVPATVARVVELELAGGFAEVVVVLGRLVLRRRVHRLLHDRTAEAIGRAVGPIHGATVGLLSAAST